MPSYQQTLSQIGIYIGQLPVLPATAHFAYEFTKLLGKFVDKSSTENVENVEVQNNRRSRGARTGAKATPKSRLTKTSESKVKVRSYIVTNPGHTTQQIYGKLGEALPIRPNHLSMMLKRMMTAGEITGPSTNWGEAKTGPWRATEAGIAAARSEPVGINQVRRRGRPAKQAATGSNLERSLVATGTD